jgi:hypothetical protein
MQFKSEQQNYLIVEYDNSSLSVVCISQKKWNTGIVYVSDSLSRWEKVHKFTKYLLIVLKSTEFVVARGGVLEQAWWGANSQIIGLNFIP